MHLRYLTVTSWGMTILGVLAIVAAAMLDIDPVWMLLGIMLLLAGVLKLGMMLIWTRVAKMGTDQHRPIDAL
jgi:peptidoglycan biosynthesis protein MviN/MurJ (putative lipid II flippase)